MELPVHSDIFPAKLLLFGEYTVLLGYRALALPLIGPKSPSAYLSIHPEGLVDDRFLFWLDYLMKNAFFQTEHKFNALQFQKDVMQGLLFLTDIPMGYGLGSSGALCAAIFHRYSTASFKRESVSNPALLKELLGYMESMFHEKSSGLDPLVSYLKKPVITGPSGIEILSNTFYDQLHHIYLIDSGKIRHTRQMVHQFNDWISNDEVFNSSIQIIGAAQEKAMDAWLANLPFEDLWKSISILQWTHMQDWIPASIQQVWKEGLDKDKWYIKLCGAGGGGYFLVLHSGELEMENREWVSLM